MERETEILIEKTEGTAARRQVEMVERKGTGHPDTICDRVMERASLALSRAYLERFGTILHHNLDKGLLVAGTTEPMPGGGRILEPMRLVYGDRATAMFRGVRIPVAEIIEAAAADWIRQNLRFVDPLRHITFQNATRPGSQELADLFSRPGTGANDTSVGVGYAPFSPTEELVLDCERFLNSRAIKERFPESGEDVKVMAVRTGRRCSLTVAMAFVDRHVRGVREYFERKEAVLEELRRFSADRPFDMLEIGLNALDDPSRAESGIYLTVLGTSAEGADSGEVGRGNRVNGLIAFSRPQSLEAAAGKNPFNHVGKIYNVLAREIAMAVHREVDGLEEASIFLCSRIGRALSSPLVASAVLGLEAGVTLGDVRPAVEAVIRRELAAVDRYRQRLAGGEFSLS
ncbi:methionine adenosyltransferase [Chlorobium sp. N1]|uniref:methionine adenosyltransferase n=1 Tax=Chlorobium sp. N1 TaxID=2491138 RepID=UPI0010404D0B|nr:methionine adenosyltransferase [Chlorobium sp. N1]TCD46975.1 methionine adenosyltransferase [Chlorobium sp. N1]